MYGLVNAAAKELVCSAFGVAKWNEVKAHAGVDIEVFCRMGQYPDDVTYKLVEGASKALGITTDEVLHAFGKFWVEYTGREGYGHLFDIAGHTLREFLANLDNLHTRIGQNYTHLQPPSFQLEQLGADVFRLHYYSDRRGLCPMVGGLLHGLATHFGTPINVEHDVCARLGADHCEFIVADTRHAESAISTHHQ